MTNPATQRREAALAEVNAQIDGLMKMSIHHESFERRRGLLNQALQRLVEAAQEEGVAAVRETTHPAIKQVVDLAREEASELRAADQTLPWRTP